MRQISLMLAVCSIFAFGVASEIKFGRDILPILSDNCFHCHGPDASTREADLRLDHPDFRSQVSSSDALMIELQSPQDSELIYRITTDDEIDAMPPPDYPHQLTAAEKDLIAKWIEEGAKWENHWAYEPVTDPERSKDEVKAERDLIDLLIEEKATAEGLTLAEPTSDAIWARRAALSLTGLPPQNDALKTLQANGRESYIDHLLSSPSFGEHQAWAWMEAARYADTHGYQKDNLRSMWLWRDWVINAFNSNMPFDQFTTEQLAGDLFQSPSESQLIATGFQRNHRINGEAGAIPEEFLVETVVDRVDTYSTIWLGLTASCSRCHDHKYDPLTQKEFFELSAFFNNIDETGVGGIGLTEAPDLEVTLPGYEEARSRALQSLTQAETALATAAGNLTPEREKWIRKMKERIDSSSLILSSAPSELSTDAGKKPFKVLDDQSIEIQGSVPLQETHYLSYIFPVSPSLPLSSIRLSALPLEVGGKTVLAKSFGGNFLLSTIELLVDGKKIELEASPSSQDRAGFEASLATNDDLLDGWSPPEGVVEADADFALAESINLKPGSSVQVVLHYQSREEQQIIARPRVRFQFQSIDGSEPLELTSNLFAHLVENDKEALKKQFLELSPSLAQERKTRDTAAGDSRSVEARYTAKTMVMREREGEERGTFILDRGLYDKPTDQVFPSVPAYLTTDESKVARKGFELNRLDLAKWTTAPDNPLAARVTVNRFWQQLFGTGIVKTPEDFGVQGARPTNQPLLDHLAVSFIESGWDVKGLLRRIVLTDAFSRSSVRAPEQIEADPYNLYLSSYPRRRLSAAAIRDQALMIGGLLDSTLGGPSVRPWQPPGLWEAVAGINSNTAFYEPGPYAERSRRSLYTLWKRSVPPPSLSLFDASERSVCSVGEPRTNTPMQALVTLNDPTFVSASVALARKFSDRANAVEELWLHTFNEVIPAEALELLTKIHLKALEKYQDNQDLAYSRINPKNGVIAWVPVNSEITRCAALVEVCEILLNLDQNLSIH